MISSTKSSAPVFPTDGREAGAFFDAAGSQRCEGADSLARRVMNTLYHLCAASAESSVPVFPSDGREAGAFF